MSLISSASSTSAALPTIGLHGHGHHRQGGATDTSTAQAQSSTQGLLSQLLQSLEQVTGLPVSALTGTGTATATAATTTAVGGTTAASTTAGATAASAAKAAESIHSFLHTLFQALKADGLGASASSTPASGTVAESGAGQYEGSLVSSLQTLIGQVGGTSGAGAVASNLTASFNNLIATVGGATAASGTGAATTSTAALQNFLSGLLQDVRNGGGHALSRLGASVNANV